MDFLDFITSKEFIDFFIAFSLGFIIAYFDRSIFCVRLIKKAIAEGKVSVVNGRVDIADQEEKEEENNVCK